MQINKDFFFYDSYDPISFIDTKCGFYSKNEFAILKFLLFPQKISPSDFGMKLVHFGQSVSGAPATASNKASIAVGSQGVVFVFE